MNHMPINDTSAPSTISDQPTNEKLFTMSDNLVLLYKEGKFTLTKITSQVVPANPDEEESDKNTIVADSEPLWMDSTPTDGSLMHLVSNEMISIIDKADGFTHEDEDEKENEEQGGEDAKKPSKLHSCHFCRRQFYERGSLDQHLQLHTGKKRYACDQCGKSYTNSGNLRTHIKTHTGDRPYECYHCAKTYTLRSTLQNHVRKHMGVTSHSCETCGKRFYKRHPMQVYCRQHLGDRLYACNVCHVDCTDYATFRKHKQSHRIRYTCDVCKKQFKCETSLNTHLDLHVEMAGKEEFSDNTDIVSNTISGKLEMILVEAGVNLHAVNGMSKNILGKNEVVSRIINEKSAKMVLGKTDVISRQIDEKSKSILGRREASHFPNKMSRNMFEKTVKFNCEICSKIFSTQWEFDTHKEVMHGTLYTCPICKKQFKCEKHLNVHIVSCTRAKELERKLISDGKLSCDLCRKTFASQWEFVAHRDVHSTILNEEMTLGKSDVDCPFCGCVFSRRMFLNQHVVNFHNIDGPYVCSRCDKKCPSFVSLKKHSTYHDRLKIFSCDKCEASFIDEKDFTIHVGSHEIPIFN